MRRDYLQNADVVMAFGVVKHGLRESCTVSSSAHSTIRDISMQSRPFALSAKYPLITIPFAFFVFLLSISFDLPFFTFHLFIYFSFSFFF